MKTFSASSIFVLLTPVLLTGCLTASRKVVTINVNTDGSGSGKIVFYDIKSMQEDENNSSVVGDYARLVDTWLNGDQFERANPSFTNVSKRLYADGKALNGEITFDFFNYSDIGLYRHDEAGPWMYYAYLNTSEIEHFDSSNGDFAGETMPVIFWPPGTKSFEITNLFESGDRPEVSLYTQFDRIGVEPQH